MDHLEAIINTLEEKEIREFRVFINRMRQKKGRKDLDLFDQLIRNSHSRKKQKIESENKTAYYALRKRLFRHLTDFVVLKQIDSDPSTASTVNGLVSLSSFLFDRQCPEQAWVFLKKAERLALRSEQYALMTHIYRLRIEKAYLDESLDVKELVNSHQHYRKLAEDEEKAELAFGLIRQKVMQLRQEGKPISFAATIQKTILEFGLEKVVLERPKLLFLIVSIIRDVFLIRKDFVPFESFIVQQYESILPEAFTRYNHRYKVELQYMIAHVYYRNRKFDQARAYLEHFKSSLEAYDGLHRSAYFPKYVMLKAAVDNFNGKAKEASKQLLDLLNYPTIRLTTKDRLNASLTMAVYHFNVRDFEQANTILLNLPKDSWCEKKMGKEWLLKRHLIEMIVQFELGHIEITLSRIRAIERYYKELFVQPFYYRVKRFLQFVRLFITDPDELTKENFLERFSASLEIPDEEREDTQTMAFYCWLKSKIHDVEYYPLLLKTVGHHRLKLTD